jgi:hypothetical protein
MTKSRLHCGPTTRARTSRETGSFEAKITASTRPIHSRQRSSGASASRSASGEFLHSQGQKRHKLLRLPSAKSTAEHTGKMCQNRTEPEISPTQIRGFWRRRRRNFSPQ